MVNAKKTWHMHKIKTTVNNNNNYYTKIYKAHNVSTRLHRRGRRH